MWEISDGSEEQDRNVSSVVRQTDETAMIDVERIPLPWIDSMIQCNDTDA